MPLKWIRCWSSCAEDRAVAIAPNPEGCVHVDHLPLVAQRRQLLRILIDVGEVAGGAFERAVEDCDVDVIVDARAGLVAERLRDLRIDSVFERLGRLVELVLRHRLAVLNVEIGVRRYSRESRPDVGGLRRNVLSLAGRRHQDEVKQMAVADAKVLWRCVDRIRGRVLKATQTAGEVEQVARRKVVEVGQGLRAGFGRWGCGCGGRRGRCGRRRRGLLAVVTAGDG